MLYKAIQIKEEGVTMKGRIITRNGRNIIVLSLKNDTTGKYYQKWVSCGNKRDCEKKLAELTVQHNTGIYMAPGKTTVGQFLTRWLGEYAKPSLSPRGFERYEGIVKNHIIPDLGKIQLTQLKPDRLQKHYTDSLNNGLGAQTVRYHHAVIHVALQTAVKWGLVGRNVADAVNPPRGHHPAMQTWNEDEINTFLTAAKDNPYFALFYTVLATGMRRSELLGLTWGNVDFLFSQIQVTQSLHQVRDGSFILTEPKTVKSRRTIALPPSAFLVLNEHRKEKETEALLLGKAITDDDLVFSTINRTPIRPNTVTRAWATMAAKAGVKVIRFHDARHTHASIMLKQGIHPKVVQERLGHASIAMTLDTYSHVTPGIQEAAAKRFDDVFSKAICREFVETPPQKAP